MVWEFVCPKGWEVIQRWGAPNYRTDGCHGSDLANHFAVHHGIHSGGAVADTVSAGSFRAASHHGAASPLGCDVQQLVR